MLGLCLVVFTPQPATCWSETSHIRDVTILKGLGGSSCLTSVLLVFEPAYSALCVPRQARSVPGEEPPSCLVLNLLLYTEADLWSSSIYGLIEKKLFFTQGQGRESLGNLSGIIPRVSRQAES